MKYNNPNIMEL